MNKGTRFELLVFEAVKQHMKDHGLGLDPCSCLVFRGKGYYSRDRNSSITTDVSIEVFTRGAKQPAMIWVWECKNYTGAVPVDDLEEFHSKLQQMGADRTKGTMIANCPFQRSAIEFARSMGIGLARLVTRRDFRHILFVRRPAPNSDEAFH